MSSNLTRGLDILELLSKQSAGLPLHAISEQLTTSRSTAHRILAELVETGFVTQDGEFNPYRLTLKLATLGIGYLAVIGVGNLAQPILEKLASDAGELARMALVDGERLVWVAKAQGAKSGLRYDANSEPGAEVRLFCASNGHAWLSSLTDDKALEIVARQGFGNIADFGPAAPPTIAALLERLQEARRLGYATVHDSYELGTSSIATPIRAPGETRVIGTVSIAGPTARLTPEKMKELAPKLMAAAAQLSANSAGLCVPNNKQA